MKIKLIHFNFLSENPDTANFKFANFKAKIKFWASVLTEFLFNLLTSIKANVKNLLQKYSRKVLDIFSDTPVKERFFKPYSTLKTQGSLSCLTAFLIMVSSVFSRCGKISALFYKKLFFFKKTHLGFTFFCRNPEVDGFIFSLQSFGVYKPYLIYRKI